MARSSIVRAYRERRPDALTGTDLSTEGDLAAGDAGGASTTIPLAAWATFQRIFASSTGQTDSMKV